MECCHCKENLDDVEFDYCVDDSCAKPYCKYCRGVHFIKHYAEL